MSSDAPTKLNEETVRTTFVVIFHYPQSFRCSDTLNYCCLSAGFVQFVKKLYLRHVVFESNINCDLVSFFVSCLRSKKYWHCLLRISFRDKRQINLLCIPKCSGNSYIFWTCHKYWHKNLTWILRNSLSNWFWRVDGQSINHAALHFGETTTSLVFNRFFVVLVYCCLSLSLSVYFV